MSNVSEESEMAERFTTAPRSFQIFGEEWMVTETVKCLVLSKTVGTGPEIMLQLPRKKRETFWALAKEILAEEIGKALDEKIRPCFLEKD